MYHFTECPRDAMQGWPHQIPTNTKIQYINQLLKVGFDTLDCGSFVSPKAIPQMADTKEVLAGIDMEGALSKLLVIVANERGAADAVQFEQVTYLGYPFSISETFQKLNTNASIEESLHRVAAIQNLCMQYNKEMVVYISMGFGNPYGDEYNAEIVFNWMDKLKNLGIHIFSLADTVGVSNPDNIAYLFKNLIPAHPDLKIGAHFHSSTFAWLEKLDAAVANGCTRFEGALNGIGGCPMAQDDLVGNMAMENIIRHLKIDSINDTQLNRSLEMAKQVFVH
jgi:hydroxymethylglutaryl-CoA lyase